MRNLGKVNSLAGIYMIKNNTHGKAYIGSTTDFDERFRTHLFQLKHGNHVNKQLQADYDAHNRMQFVYLHAELAPKYHVGREQRLRLYDLEKAFIEQYDTIANGYNQAPVNPWGYENRQKQKDSDE